LLQSNHMTNFLRLIAISAVLLAAACGGKTPPKSTTQTRTQTQTTTDTGNNTSSDVTEKTTKQPDGSSTVQRTETTNTAAPATPPK
jgi:hypothetical protein